MPLFPNTIFTNQTSNTTSSTFPSDGTVRTVFCSGTFDGAIVKIQSSPDNSNWFDIDGLTFNAPANTPDPVNFQIAAAVNLRATVTNAGASTSISLTIS